MTNVTTSHRFRTALARTPQFIYGNGLRLAMLSIIWATCSVPLVTVGPATLGAYVAIQDLRSDRNTIDYDRIRKVLRKNGPASLLFTGVPVAFGIVSVSYGLQALRAQSVVGEIVALGTGYAALYFALALIPTFVAMASGAEPTEALRYGLGWLAAHPTAALATALLTVVLLTLSLLLTIAFVVVFPGVAFSIHVGVVESIQGDRLPTTSPSAQKNP